MSRCTSFFRLPVNKVRRKRGNHRVNSVPVLQYINSTSIEVVEEVFPMQPVSKRVDIVSNFTHFLKMYHAGSGAGLSDYKVEEQDETCMPASLESAKTYGSFG
jgi:hypothetical protein